MKPPPSGRPAPRPQRTGSPGCIRSSRKYNVFHASMKHKNASRESEQLAGSTVEQTFTSTSPSVSPLPHLRHRFAIPRVHRRRFRRRTTVGRGSTSVAGGDYQPLQRCRNTPCKACGASGFCLAAAVLRSHRAEPVGVYLDSMVHSRKSQKMDRPSAKIILHNPLILFRRTSYITDIHAVCWPRYISR